MECFALRSGDEHQRLRFKNCQITFLEKPYQRRYLQYTEDASKNNQDGIRDRRTKAKLPFRHENAENSARFPVRLFKPYNQLCPNPCPDSAFYLKPLSKPQKDCWFSSTPLVHNTLDNMVKEMCEVAKIWGFRTNHSLKVTTATRLYQA